jgi:hypothetical protein
MKKIISVFLGATLTFAEFSFSAGNDKSKAIKGNSARVENTRQNSQSNCDTKMKARKAKGDTLAMPYAELQKYLPNSVSGYKAEKPAGSTINMTGMSYSMASIRFSKDNTNWVKITIMDYNKAYGIYNSVTAMWGSGMSIDSEQEKANGVKISNSVAGWQDYKKTTKDATVSLGVGCRFWISVEASNQPDADMVLSVAKSMDLNKLSSL